MHESAFLKLEFLLAQAHSLMMDANSSLKVRVEKCGNKYAWELYRDGGFQRVKFSVPVYLSEEAARASGNEVRLDHLARLAQLADRRQKVK
jgi:hypothetical protein